jgi:hypothetical protein
VAARLARLHRLGGGPVIGSLLLDWQQLDAQQPS